MLLLLLLIHAISGAIAVIVLGLRMLHRAWGLLGLLLLVLANTGTIAGISSIGDSNDIHSSRLRRLLRRDNGSSWGASMRNTSCLESPFRFLCVCLEYGAGELKSPVV